MKTIILATDFSPAALNAANYAAELAKALDGDLLLMHVYYLFEGFSELPSMVTAGQLEEDAIDSMEKLKADLNAKYSNLPVRTEVTRGIFLKELKQACEKVNAYCVVVGSQGASASDYRFFGSQSVAAMKELDCPVIAVPANVKFTPLKNIGVACDLQNGVEHIPVGILKELIADFKASLHIINSSGSETQKTKIMEEASSLMVNLAPVHHEFHFIQSGNEDDGIMEFAEKNNLDLLIVLPKKHSLFEKWLNKSHTRKLVLNMKVPVMSLHLEKPKW